MVSPHQHPCDEQTIDYSTVGEGRLVCTVCGRVWRWNGSAWEPNPLTKHRPRG